MTRLIRKARDGVGSRGLSRGADGRDNDGVWCPINRTTRPGGLRRIGSRPRSGTRRWDRQRTDQGPWSSGGPGKSGSRSTRTRSGPALTGTRSDQSEGGEELARGPSALLLEAGSPTRPRRWPSGR